MRRCLRRQCLGVRSGPAPRFRGKRLGIKAGRIVHGLEEVGVGLSVARIARKRLLETNNRFIEGTLSHARSTQVTVG